MRWTFLPVLCVGIAKPLLQYYKAQPAVEHCLVCYVSLKEFGHWAVLLAVSRSLLQDNAKTRVEDANACSGHGGNAHGGSASGGNAGKLEEFCLCFSKRN